MKVLVELKIADPGYIYDPDSSNPLVKKTGSAKSFEIILSDDVRAGIEKALAEAECWHGHAVLLIQKVIDNENNPRNK